MSDASFILFSYEETYFTRLPFTRQERHSSRQQYSSKSLASELAGMGSLPEKGGAKRKTPGGKKKGKKIGVFCLGMACSLCLLTYISFSLFRYLQDSRKEGKTKPDVFNIFRFNSLTQSINFSWTR